MLAGDSRADPAHDYAPPIAAFSGRLTRDQYALNDFAGIFKAANDGSLFSAREAQDITDLGVLAGHELIEANLASERGDDKDADGHLDAAEACEDRVLAWLKLGVSRATAPKV